MAADILLPQPIDVASIAQIDEALFHASLVPPDERGPFWQRWIDSLTDQRNRLTRETP